MRRGAVIAVMALATAILLGLGPETRSKARRAVPPKKGAPDIRLRVGPDEVLTVSLYLNRLRDEKAYLAIDEYFDVDGFMARIFGDDLKSLLPEQYAYARQMACVLIKATVTLVPAEEWKQPIAIANLKLLRVDTDTAMVRLSRPGGGEIPFELHRNVKGWRIADLPPLAESLKPEYARLKADARYSPVDYLETLLARTLEQKRNLKQRELSAAPQR